MKICRKGRKYYMKIAIAGLGKMGIQIAKKLHEDSFIVVAYNRSRNSVDEMKILGMIPAYTKQEVINSFNDEQVIIWIMVPADVVEEELNDWLKLAPRGSVLIDGGNSDFRLTKKRADLVSKRGSVLMDSGTSGGVWGYMNGFSIMIGGDTKTFKIIEPIFKTLSKPSGA